MTLSDARRRQMQPGEVFVEGCTGKVQHRTKRDAKVVIRRLKSQGEHGKFGAYRCENCGWIHVTSHHKTGRISE